MKYKVMLLILSVPLSGCFMAQQSTLVTKKVHYNPQEQARIRLFGPYGKFTIKPYSATSCDAWSQKQGKAMHHKFVNGLPKKIRNISIGIPATAGSLSADKDTGIMTRGSYKEYVISAGKPLVLDGSLSAVMRGHTSSCRIAGSFVPKAGQDYEAYYQESKIGCTIAIKEITPVTGTQAADTQDVNQVEKCTLPRSDAF